MSLWKSLAPMALMAGGALVGGPVGAAAGGAIGGAIAGDDKHQQELDRQHRSAELASATARYSPWTHMTPGAIQWAGSDTDAIGGGALSGAVSGYQLGSTFAGSPAAAAKPASAAFTQPALGSSAFPAAPTTGFLGANTNLAGPGTPPAGTGYGLGGNFNFKQSPWPTMFGNNNQYASK